MTRLAFTNARLIDGSGAEPRSNTTLLVEDGTIQAINPDSETDADRIHDIGGKTVMPGLIDAHVHLTLTGNGPLHTDLSTASKSEQVLRAAGAARRTVQAGFTTVRDVGASGYIDIALRSAVEQGHITGPKILASGPGICQTGGSGDFEPPWLSFPAGSINTPVDSEPNIRAAVRERVKRDVDSIKTVLTGGVRVGLDGDGSAREFTPSEVRALYEAANASGMPVAAHCMTPEPIAEAIDEGLAGGVGDTVEHGIFLHRDQDTLSAMADAGVAFVPTLTIYRRMAAADDTGPAAKTRDAHQASVQAARDAGVTVACGTDVGGPGAPHGDNAEELRALVDAGMTPSEAITAATRNTARALGIDDHVGTLVPGKAADLLVVDGRPDRDVSALTASNIDLVVRGGDPVVGHPELV